ncbi:hypothetical protein MNBD_GAMMA22-731 [hydrothermal vent metagenome]|uniref:Metallo-beta-lactamase domain-containing protein n=1 Tax=hydrothermal vent metagenome TaxID=652676 RepID=A0A3B0ZIZ3_9ZZZZ
MLFNKKIKFAFLSVLPFLFISQPVLSAQDELSVMVLGSGGPVAKASGRASASYMIFTDGNPRVLMDVGGGSFQRLAASGFNINDMEYFLLSHLHLDHTGDMSSIIKTIYFHNPLARTRRSNPIHIYGPTNDPQNNDYSATIDYADAHYAAPDGTERYLTNFVRQITQGTSRFNYVAHNLNATVQGAAIEEVLRTNDGLVITAIAVTHGTVPAVAFRVEYKGNSIVYSGDTSSASDNMITLAQDADILIYDTAITDTLPPSPFFRSLHTTPTRIGQVASQANVKNLILSHITPITEPRIAEVMQSIRNQGYVGQMVESNDLDRYDLPVAN